MQNITLDNKFLTPCEVFTYHLKNRLKESNNPLKLLEKTRLDLIDIFNNKNKKTGEPIVPEKTIFGGKYKFTYERFFLDDKVVRGAITPEIFSYLLELKYKLENTSLDDKNVIYPKALHKHEDQLLKTDSGNTMLDPFFGTGGMFIARILILKNNLAYLNSKEKLLKRILKKYHGNETDRDAVEVGIERLNYIFFDKFNEHLNDDEKNKLRNHITSVDLKNSDFEELLKVRRKRKLYDFVMTIIPDKDIYDLEYHKKLITGIHNITIERSTPVITIPCELLRYKAYKKLLFTERTKIQWIDYNEGVSNSLYTNSTTIVYTHAVSSEKKGFWFKYQNTDPDVEVEFEGLNRVKVFETKEDFINEKMSFKIKLK